MEILLRNTIFWQPFFKSKLDFFAKILYDKIVRGVLVGGRYIFCPFFHP